MSGEIKNNSRTVGAEDVIRVSFGHLIFLSETGIKKQKTNTRSPWSNQLHLNFECTSILSIVVKAEKITFKINYVT